MSNDVAQKSGLRNQLYSDEMIFRLASLLCCVPVFLAQFPPMVDLPQHAAQIALWMNLGDSGFPFTSEFRVNLFTPYLLGYSLIAAITPALGILTACKVIIGLALAAFAHSTRFLLQRTGADPYWSWLIFPVLYGFAYQWGFLNFLIAAPVGLYFLGFVWRSNGNRTPGSSLLVASLLYLLFFSHALILALVCLIALTYWWHTNGSWQDFIKDAWPVATLAPLVVVWLISASHNSQVHEGTIWDLSWFNTDVDFYYSDASDWIDPEHPGWGRITGFIPRLVGLRPEVFATLFGVMLFLLPFLGGGRIAGDKIRLIPLLLVASILMLMPSYFFGVAFTYQRFTLLAIPFFLIMIDAPRQVGRVSSYLRKLAPAIALVWIAYASVQAIQSNRDAAGFDEVLAQMDPYKRARSLIFVRDDGHSIAPPFMHFPAWYSALKLGTTNPSFAAFYQMPVVYQENKEPSVHWSPTEFDWQADEGYKYDYFVISAPGDPGPYLFRYATCAMNLEMHSGIWWLYSRDANC